MSLRTLLAAAFFSVWFSVAAAAEPDPKDVGASEEKQLMSRIDFGNAYVMGQSIKSGAVYLLNRKKSEIRSMLEERKDFREEIREDSQAP